MRYPDNSKIVEMLRNEDYSNPLTGEYFGSDDAAFAKEVTMYFNAL